LEKRQTVGQFALVSVEIKLTALFVNAFTTKFATPDCIIYWDTVNDDYELNVELPVEFIVLDGNPALNTKLIALFNTD
jgi:hypothetical protein